MLDEETGIMMARLDTAFREVIGRDNVAVGTGTWGIAAVIPKYLSLRLDKGMNNICSINQKWVREPHPLIRPIVPSYCSISYPFT